MFCKSLLSLFLFVILLSQVQARIGFEVEFGVQAAYEDGDKLVSFGKRHVLMTLNQGAATEWSVTTDVTTAAEANLKRSQFELVSIPLRTQEQCVAVAQQMGDLTRGIEQQLNAIVKDVEDLFAGINAKSGDELKRESQVLKKTSPVKFPMVNLITEAKKIVKSGSVTHGKDIAKEFFGLTRVDAVMNTPKGAAPTVYVIRAEPQITMGFRLSRIPLLLIALQPSVFCAQSVEIYDDALIRGEEVGAKLANINSKIVDDNMKGYLTLLLLYLLPADLKSGPYANIASNAKSLASTFLLRSNFVYITSLLSKEQREFLANHKFGDAKLSFSQWIIKEGGLKKVGSRSAEDAFVFGETTRCAMCKPGVEVTNENAPDALRRKNWIDAFIRLDKPVDSMKSKHAFVGAEAPASIHSSFELSFDKPSEDDKYEGEYLVVAELRKMNNASPIDEFEQVLSVAYQFNHAINSAANNDKKTAETINKQYRKEVVIKDSRKYHSDRKSHSKAFLFLQYQ